MSRAQVEKILGQAQSHNALRDDYWFRETLPMPAAILADARARNPELSEKEVLEKLGPYTRDVGFQTRYEKGKLTFLAISVIEVNQRFPHLPPQLRKSRSDDMQ